LKKSQVQGYFDSESDRIRERKEQLAREVERTRQRLQQLGLLMSKSKSITEKSTENQSIMPQTSVNESFNAPIENGSSIERVNDTEERHLSLNQTPTSSQLPYEHSAAIQGLENSEICKKESETKSEEREKTGGGGGTEEQTAFEKELLISNEEQGEVHPSKHFLNLYHSIII
jgi:hypothetical protein